MIAPAHSSLIQGLGEFIQSLITGVEVIQGQVNLVPMPVGQFICMTPIMQRRLSTNVSTYRPDDGERDVMQPTEYTIQLDCYGPDSSDHATTISTMLRDFYGCDFLRPFQCQPLFTGEPSQVPLINGEENYEQRWMVEAVLQFNPIVTTPQEFADELAVESFVNVSTTYTPIV